MSDGAKTGTPVEAILRAMAENYGGGHSWDDLDAEACTKAADLIENLETALTEALKVAGEAETALQWALAHIREPNRIIGQNDTHCDNYQSAKSALAALERIRKP